MPIRVVIDEQDLSAVPESVRADYAKGEDGRYYLQAEGIDDHPQVQGLRRTLKKFRDVEPNADRLKARLERLAPWEDFGDEDPSEVRDRLKELEELKASGGGTADEVKSQLETVFNRRLDAAKSELSKSLEAKEGEIASLRSFIQRKVLDEQLDRALDEIGVIKELRPGARARLKEEGPKVVEDPDQMFKGVFQTDLGDLEVADFVKKWATTDEAKHYLPPSGNNGTGVRSGGSGGARHHNNPWSKDSLNLTQQAKIFRENPTLAKQMAADAGVRLP